MSRLAGGATGIISGRVRQSLDLAASRTKRFAVLLVVLMLSLPAHAMFCLPLGSAGMAIGFYEPLSAQAQDAQASLAIECFPAAPGEQLRLNVRLLNAADGRLNLINSSAGNNGTLTVRVYRDAARTLPMDAQAVISFTDRPILPTRYWVTVFARVPARQDAAAGHYRLPLMLAIDY